MTNTLTTGNETEGEFIPHKRIRKVGDIIIVDGEVFVYYKGECYSGFVKKMELRK